ncbi:MAG: methionyl-tRNA formyltransferase [Puniceicoccales bacterium]|jgi:methionyl-tRNA formyltransferase|nr:methionyl-tRNA formyltransferase [Puniceicoccales bacterium]
MWLLVHRIAFIGSDGIGERTLAWLAANDRKLFRLAGVVCGQDVRAGRGMKLQKNSIGKLAARLGLELLQTDRPNGDLLPWLREREVDLAIIFAYGHILVQAVLDGLPLGFLNLHASLLPELRGPSPIEGAILQRKKKTGITLMKMVLRMDAGPIYGRLSLPIAAKETAPTLREKLGSLAPSLLMTYLPGILDGSLRPTEQDESLATYTKMIRKEDGRLNFSLSAAQLEAQVRAYGTWPGSFFPLGAVNVRVGRAEIGPTVDGVAPGAVLGLREDFLEIAAAEGTLRCRELQLPTRKMLPAKIVWERLTAATELVR